MSCNIYYPFFTSSGQIKFRWQSLLLCALQSTALYVPHPQKWQKDSFSAAHSNHHNPLSSCSERQCSPNYQWTKDGYQLFRSRTLLSRSILKTQVIQCEAAISIALWLCNTNLCSSWFQPHSGLWSFSFGRQDSTKAVQGLHLLIKWITNYTHDLSQKAILPKVPPRVLVIKGSMAQQSPRHGIGSSSAVTVFEPNLIFFLPSWPISPQKAQQAHSEPQENPAGALFSAATAMGWCQEEAPVPRSGGRSAGLCHSHSCELAVYRGDRDTKGLRDYQKVTAARFLLCTEKEKQDASHGK